nr:WAS/WASL-interacting protein family member 1-like [Aegilops tauschii subsp. strangulata]
MPRRCPVVLVSSSPDATSTLPRAHCQFPTAPCELPFSWPSHRATAQSRTRTPPRTPSLARSLSRGSSFDLPPLPCLRPAPWQRAARPRAGPRPPGLASASLRLTPTATPRLGSLPCHGLPPLSPAAGAQPASPALARAPEAAARIRPLTGACLSPSCLLTR